MSSRKDLIAATECPPSFDRFYGANDDATYRVAQQVLRGEHAWLESGIIDMIDEDLEAGEAIGAPKRRPVGAKKELVG